ncbi:MAG: hypothetical protein IMZ66_09375, partial [Planctomycetes bacterium]|nr:hypothetical protein [Planctomycetota bacterium]
MRGRVLVIAVALVAAASVVGASPVAAAPADDAAALRLVPFPKEVSLRPGLFALDRRLVLEVPADIAETVGRLLAEELRRAGLPEPEVRGLGGEASWWRLSAEPGSGPPTLGLRDGATPEDYALEVGPDAVACRAAGRAGLLYGVQTLRQLVRANRSGTALACLT